MNLDRGAGILLPNPEPKSLRPTPQFRHQTPRCCLEAERLC